MKRRYTVVWWESARKELAETWLGSTRRADVSRFVDSVESDLALHPESVGEEFHEGIRVVESPDLTMYFMMSNQDRLVEVVRLRRKT